jgi:hypothetical protein
VLEQVEDAADIRMRDLAGELHLAPEALRHPIVGRDVGADGLDGDLFVQLEIACFVELAHAASGDEAHDLKTAAQQVIRGERWGHWNRGNYAT